MPDRIVQPFVGFYAGLGADRAAEGRPLADVLQPQVDVSGWYRDGAPLPPGTSLFHASLLSPAPNAANFSAVGLQAGARPLIIYSILQTGPNTPFYAFRGDQVIVFSAWFGAAPTTPDITSFIGATPTTVAWVSAAGAGPTAAQIAAIRSGTDPRLYSGIGFVNSASTGLPSGIGGSILLPPGGYIAITSPTINLPVDVLITAREIPAPNEGP